jgi:peptidoglycan hydrolase-like protein with peptidoglycan-binding domain
MKKNFSILLFLFVFNFSYALSPLPKNAYLRAGDEQKEVLILQQILNSDADTLITKTGAGSPGKETWFFGAYTTSALKKFQEKYGLEITGQIDFKTWNKINQYVASKNPVVKKVASSTAKTATTSEKNIYLDDTENPYISSDKKETKTTNTTTEPTYLDSILAKYTGALTPIIPTTQTISNTNPTSTYSPSAPYYNPQTGQYQSSPAQTSFGASSPYSTGAPSLQPTSAQRPSTLDALRTYLSRPEAGNIKNGGLVSGLAGDVGQCRATSFAHATLAEGCVADRNDQQNGQKSASGIILSRVGVPAIPAVALPSRGSFGDAVEVKDLKTGKCKAFPLLDRGPGTGPQSKGVCIDLTGSAVDILRGNLPCKNVGQLGEGTAGINLVQFAIIPGEKIKPGEVKDCTHLVN